ncbi:BglG family transcription antiterminator [Breznakia pachnodae]|uniref:Ascorbate-specific PTS system EIIA component n=1 Tax=Breznakia pachnodae TaxID=265178 RepID=A0ABU0E6F6_9FIRM|nr:BglG family transcription antiterminator [Breznakia pachnodae]MDQ0362455.1 transcriptional antiterminator/mannitol/fructose-specific phosphotransferase system IIA component (Ntr-type) [Breznakia pachnodae]
MNERNTSILNCLIKQSPTSVEKIIDDFGLSKRQIEYSISQINDELALNKVSKIRKTSGKYYINDEIIKWFTSLTNADHGYVYSQVERVYAIIIQILLRNEPLSLDYFSYELGVSKNTVLTDMKKCDEIFKKANVKLSIVNSKVDGYFIKGNEWDKRSMFMKAIQYMLENSGEGQLSEVMNLSNEEYAALEATVQNVEDVLSLHFTDYHFILLIYYLKAILTRITKKSYVAKNFFIESSELSDTDEYEASKIILSEFEDIPQSELLYMTLHLLTSNAIKKEVLDSKELTKLRDALEEFILEFERNSLIDISNKEVLLERLLSHFKPAYYRIKYNLTTSYDILDKVSKGFGAINTLVSQSISPVETYLGCTIPDNEIAYITLFMGGTLVDEERNQLINHKRTYAVVVCQSGVSMSNLMKSNLINIFPEFVFYPAMSKRSFESFDKEYSIVFSSIQLTTNKPLFIVNEIMSEEEKYYLKKRVMSTLYDTEITAVDIESAVKLIRDSMKDNFDESRLKEELYHLLNNKTVDIKQPKEKPVTQKNGVNLADLVKVGGISIIDDVDDWKDAVVKSSNLLLESEKITKAYQDKLVEVFKESTPHIILNQKIAIPHLEARYGSLDLGMSLLLIKNKPDDLHIPQVFVTISVVEGLDHLTALNQVMKLARNEQLLEELYSADSDEAVLDVLYRI